MAMLTAEQAKNILENMAREDPMRFPVAVQTLLIHAFSLLDRSEQVLRALAKEVKELRGAPVAEDPATDVPEQNGGGVRVGADGSPITHDQAEAEALMDAAAGKHPMDVPARPKKQRGTTVGAAPPAAALTPNSDQAAIEAAMDAAAGPRE